MAWAGQQHNRLLRLRFPRDDKPGGAIMLVNRLVADEGLSRDFRFEVEVLSDDARIPLKQMIGKMVTVSMVREDGTLRHFNGYVTEFSLAKTDGGFAYYGMVLEPWLAFAKLRRNSAVFLERTVVDITETIFKHYEQRDWQLALYNEYAPLSCAIQYDETDHNHLHRRWEDLGWHYWYEHREDGHTLWIGDMTQMAAPIEPGGNTFVPDEIPFRRNAGSDEADGIHQWRPIRRASPAGSTVGGFDYKRPHPQTQTRPAKNAPGAASRLDIYENQGGYAFSSFDAGDGIAKRRMEERDARAQFFEAAGNDRTVQPGRSFKLGGHFSGAPRVAPPGEPAKPSLEKREYLILSATHTASNNYQAGSGEHSHFECTFTCMRKDVPWRPGRGFNSKAVIVPGVQTAIVVGPQGQDIHTDEYGRVKVQFHWDRERKNNEASSAWVRVASVWAGNDLGFIAVPRIGQEVAVQWIAGNPDHPLIIGRVFNSENLPPWQLNGQRALSGLRSRELTPGGGNAAGGRSNHLILDDTNGEIQAQLKSDHQCSQLSLGHITRIEDKSGRADFRGEGWELATNAWGVARAGQGMLITTEARPDASSHIKDMEETSKQLSTATNLQERLVGLAQHYGAQEEQEAQQNDTVNDLKSQNQAIHGGGTGKFSELSEPHLVVASPAGIELSSAQSTHIASSRHTAITSGKNLSIASTDGFFASIGKTFRLFVHKAGMKLIAAGGKVSVQAQDDDVEVIANKVLALLSESDWVDIRGKKGVRLHGANHMLEISEKTQFFTSSPVLFHGNLETLPPKSIPSASEQKRQFFATTNAIIETDYQLESLFAFKQLEQVANTFTHAEFVMLLAPIFGYDIPAATYIKLYEGLKNSLIKQPTIKIMRSCHYPASFNNETREILVHQTAADRAAAGNDKSWELLTSLIHEFGHYIDLVLRKDLAEKHPDGTSTLVSDADGDEGAKFAYNIAFFDFCNSNSTIYATYRSPAFSGELKVDYKEIQQFIKESQNESAQHNEGKDGNIEFFGAGMGEHNEHRPHTSFGHQSIERSLREASIHFKDVEVLDQIYFGNWLRDYSQLIDPSIVRKPESPKNFPRAISRQELTELVDVFAEAEFVKRPEQRSIFKVTPSVLGVYRPIEHIDNPTNNSPNAPDPTTIDKDFQPKASVDYTSIDPQNSMKKYIEFSAIYMSNEIKKALHSGPGAEGYRHFGAALHVLEDYFAHSNFVELSLRKVGYSNVLPWTSPAPGKHNLPVVTGMFDSDDVIASTAGTIADILFKVESKFKPIKPGERTKSDRIILIFLREHSDPLLLQAYKDYLSIRDNLAKIPGYNYVKKISFYTTGPISNIYNFVYSSLLHILGNSVDDQQIVRIGNPNTNGSTDPTHSQLAKDHDNHPFHTLAAELAKVAVRDVGSAIAAHWWDSGSTTDPAMIARGYLAHPFDTIWQDKIVADWAEKHPQEVKRGESATEWEAIEKAHKKEVLESLSKVKKNKPRSLGLC